MKLLNQSIRYIAIPVLVVISLWALLLYFSIYREIKDSTDEGLDNYKRQIVFQAQIDSTILEKYNFDDSFFSINPINKISAHAYKDTYSDTLMYMQDSDDPYPELEPARMLSTAFGLDGEYYELKVIHYMIEEDDLVKQLFWNILWLFTALFLTIIAINHFVLRELWRPFYSFLSQLKRYRLGSSNHLPQIKTNIKEFNDLGSATNTLLKHNTAVFEQQKEFISNASHELQTPLAIAVNKLELLIEEGNLSNIQAERISETMGIIERLVRVNKSLLLLSKIENRQFMDNQNVSINVIVKQNINDLSEIAEYKGIVISLVERDNVNTIMDSSLANIIISNLIRNSIFHNHPDGSVLISIDNNRMAICNTGEKNHLNENNLFERFYKSNKNSSNTGLGLAIVKAICNLYGHKINYHYKDNKHCFEIIFNK